MTWFQFYCCFFVITTAATVYCGFPTAVSHPATTAVADFSKNGAVFQSPLSESCCVRLPRLSAIYSDVSSPNHTTDLKLHSMYVN